MVSEEGSGPAATEQREESSGGNSYRQYLADVLSKHVTKGGLLDHPEAIRQLMAVTGRSLTTVKNWIIYRINLPDVEALGKIVHHWGIDPAEIFPDSMDEMLGMGPAAESGNRQAAKPVAFDIKNAVMLSPFGSRDESSVVRAIAKYSDYPKSTMFVRQDSADMDDVIRIGELMLVDSSAERITVNGMYLLRYSDPTGADHTVVRIVVIQGGKHAARLTCTNPLMTGSEETLPLSDGYLPSNVSILGKVVGVLKQT